MHCMEMVRIYNYDSERAEQNRILSDKKLCKMKKEERNGRITQLVIVAVMFLCVIAMACCSIGALVLSSSKFETLVAVGMATMACVSCLFVVVLMRRTYRKLHEIDEYETTFDNAETRYHRLTLQYDYLEPRLEKDAIVVMCYNKDNQLVCSHEFRPSIIQQAEVNKLPVYDLLYDCLWVPAVA